VRAHWTDKALLRLQQVHDHIAEDGPVNAQRFVDRLTRKAALIASQPRAGVVVEKYQRDDIRETYEASYRIVYRIHLDRIDVLTVRHGARRMPKHLRNL
jgi:plasmid stabilization system protein ParE